jgi:hypothetical protein
MKSQPSLWNSAPALKAFVKTHNPINIRSQHRNQHQSRGMRCCIAGLTINSNSASFYDPVSLYPSARKCPHRLQNILLTRPTSAPLIKTERPLTIHYVLHSGEPEEGKESCSVTASWPRVQARDMELIAVPVWFLYHVIVVNLSQLT